MINDQNDIVTNFSIIQSRHQYQCEKFKHILTQSEKILFIWTNIQPNLKSAIESVGDDFDRYMLTHDRYTNIKLACHKLTPNHKVIFVTRDCDCVTRLHLEPEVVILKQIPRSRDYMGSDGLFDFLREIE